VHWHHLWFGYFVPSLWGNGPEALVQTVVYGTLALVLVPPVRKWVERHVKAHFDQLHARLDKEKTELHAKLDSAHQKLSHIIEHHPDIPPFEEEK